jgi:sulfhydrogenase subunit beta (sulfur reductase)
MRGRLIHKNDLLKLVDFLRKEFRVVAPFAGRDRDSFFEEVTDTNRDAIAIHVPNPYYPPKRYVLPHIQKLLKIKAGEKPAIEELIHSEKVAIFGIRSCDVEGIFHLDRFYLGNTFKDTYYETLRKNLFLVNMVCSDTERDIDHDCFCVCADAGPAAKNHFDLQLMDLHDASGDFLAVAGTPAGEALFNQPFFRTATSTHIARRRSILNDVRKHFKVATSWYSAVTKFITRGKIQDKTWKLIGDRCLECGGCSYVCPTCTCFTVTDRPAGNNTFERVRCWDACALSGFTRMAGGHNPRQAVHDRRNRRFFRKLSHYFIQREFTMACVGCGRCVRVCHGDIGMPAVVEILRRETAASVQQEQS